MEEKKQFKLDDLSGFLDFRNLIFLSLGKDVINSIMHLRSFERCNVLGAVFKKSEVCNFARTHNKVTN